MVRHAWFAALVVLGCREPARGTQEAPETRAANPSPGDPARSSVTMSTHGAQITVVAVSDRAEVALSADELGELRFWPSLDGTREPVVVHGRPSSQLVITREHDGYVAALLDDAHGIELVRLAASGAVTGRQVIAADPGFDEIVAGDAVLLGRERDQRIVRLDTNPPQAKRVLAAEPGEQLLAIAARHRGAVAGIADPDHPGEIHTVRRLVLGRDLAWGPTITLPVPLRAPIALSPSGNRVAGFNARTNDPVLVELGPVPRLIATAASPADSPDDALGFLDDDHVVFRGGTIVSPVPGRPPVDPWNAPRSTLRVTLGNAPAVADGVVVSGHGTSLEISNTVLRQFLGYHDVGLGFLRTGGGQITLNFGSRVLWLDDALGVVRAKTIELDAVRGLAVSDRHLLKVTFTNSDLAAIEVTLVDAVTGTEQRLGRWSQGSTVAYDHDTSVFAVMGPTKTITRSRLDVATGTTTPLRPLRARENATVTLLDPARAAGVVAVTHAPDDRGLRLETFVDDPEGTSPLAPASSVVISDEVSAFGTDVRGTTYVVTTAMREEPKPIDGYRDGTRVLRVLVDGQATAGAVDPRGTLLAIVMPHGVAVVGLDGVERWRAPMWQLDAVEFTSDGRTLLANTQGGLVAFDAATGKRRGTACSWNFGLSAQEPSTTVFPSPVVCAEPLDQTGTP